MYKIRTELNRKYTKAILTQNTKFQAIAVHMQYAPLVLNLNEKCSTVSSNVTQFFLSQMTLLVGVEESDGWS